MRFIGIDYGKKNIGLALSNDEQTFAFPLEVYKNDASFLSKFLKICEESKIGGIVLGESLNFAGQPNRIMKDILTFKTQLEDELKVPIYFEPEFLTTKEASHIQGEHAKSDASAAALILQSFLNKNKI